MLERAKLYASSRRFIAVFTTARLSVRAVSQLNLPRTLQGSFLKIIFNIIPHVRKPVKRRHFSVCALRCYMVPVITITITNTNINKPIFPSATQ